MNPILLTKERSSSTGLRMKYFVLKPRGKDDYAFASRRALIAYANAIEAFNYSLAQELRDWAAEEGLNAVDSEGKEGSIYSLQVDCYDEGQRFSLALIKGSSVDTSAGLVWKGSVKQLITMLVEGGASSPSDSFKEEHDRA